MRAHHTFLTEFPHSLNPQTFNMSSEKHPLESPGADKAHADTIFDGIISLDKDAQLQRGLKSRHIQFLALGGAIGTGLFVGSGNILSKVGPVPLWLGYLSMMAVVWVIMNNVAEMTTYLPLKGITLPYFTNRYVDNSLAFASGWNYWYAYSILVAAEASAGAILLDYWETPVPSAVWITIILLVCLFLNIIAVEVFGEAEFWFASIKLITILGLIIVAIVIMAGGAPAGEAIGFKYWNEPDRGGFKQYLTSGSTGRFLAYWTAFARCGFSFITSPELIGTAAGETVAPRRNIPKAARRFLYRLAVFYGVSSLLIGCLVSSDNDRLVTGASNASASPWVIGIQEAGIKGLNHVINAAILTSAWSAGNAFVYSGSRILYSLACTGQAPAIFTRTTKRGVPYAAVLGTWSLGLLAYLNVNENSARVFEWFMNISTISGYIAWIIVMITYLRFRKALEFNGLLNTLPFKTIGQPYATWITLVVITLLTITNGFHVFVPFSYKDFLAAYITIPAFFVLYFGHKLWHRTPWLKKLDQIDVLTGKKEMDEMEEADVPPVASNWIQKVWYWIA